jgi:hypothetical protein
MDTFTEEERACWPGDLFNRAQDADFIYRFLLGRLDERESRGQKRSFVLNIEGEWGRGKTVFLDGLARYLRLKNHPVAEVNAWRDDFAPDPMVAFMAALEDLFDGSNRKAVAAVNAVRRKSGPVIAALGKGMLDTGLKKYTGLGVGTLMEMIAGEDIGEAATDTIQIGIGNALAKLDALATAEAQREVARFRQTRKDIDAFASSLETLATRAGEAGKSLPIFVVIDELDRCRPSYAIALLERIKHIFSAQNIVFIMGTNTVELANAVGAVYGAGFNGRRYLNRFFDRTYALPTPSIADYVSELLKSEDANDGKVVEVLGTDLATYSTYLFECFDLDLRGVAQCLDLWQTIRISWTHKAAIQVGIMLPLIVADYLQMDLAIGPTFQDALKDRAKGDVSSPIRTGPRFEQTKETDWSEVFSALVKAMRRNTWDDDTDNSLISWARGNMIDESNATRQRMLLQHYPSIIATAGRITAS